MSRDLYAAVAGASATWTQMTTIGQNMANVSTSGYREGQVAFRVTGHNPGTLGQSYAQTTEVYANLEDGTLEHTGEPLHLALSGPGWFVLQDGKTEALTRDGRFSLDADGQLVNGRGLPVLGEGGPIEIPRGEAVRVDVDGNVYGSESGLLDRIRVGNAAATPIGGNLWRPVGRVTTVESPRIEQGALESSNVDPMATMVELIEASRYFEAFEKAMQTSDDLDERLNRLGGS